MKTTPGPWLVYETTVYSPDRHRGVAACAPDPFCKEHYAGGPGGNFFAPPEDLAERLANAQLIAAALDLLEAARLAQQLMLDRRAGMDWPPSQWTKAHDLISAAITKAETGK